MPNPFYARYFFERQKLYIYGAGFDIEVYDAATLQHEKTWDLQTDVTYAGIAVLP